MRPNGIFGGTPRSIVGRYIPTTIIIRNGSGNQILGWKLKAMMLYITDIWESSTPPGLSPLNLF